MPETSELGHFLIEVEREIVDLLGRTPAVSPQGAHAAQVQSMEREERAARRSRRIAGDQLERRRQLADGLEDTSGEVWLRERLSATPWGVPKEVWRARRDREREVLDDESALLDERLEARRRYLADLQQLEPNAPWKDDGDVADVSIAEVDRLWRERRRAADERARELLAQPDIRDALCHALQTSDTDPHDFARVVTPALYVLPDQQLHLPVVYASLALLACREGPRQLGCS